mmetsp:Transcript_34870/g.62713  ORF Transcript_34870/g.62713 Transcript_34870/m.62713 type:complete len:701 (-) Transcript_34870:235-2337(-)|eukprot:CAMPEP_0175044958 /NCGR_PEP_ID=MMETSP0052_2-20121109/4125_1 /TAXON_ID=51329 ORGANISM="Polytomella parva, Strain SAG 63-3" /NCGR_SAMPLE_ID=MMETSP0052_2 /ASSEMBLY_ACC=CAM_ASM_000194 /LENGTH=700 /DNA_ID=CAMNT_0016308373 /DNA_START=36 /DNA_END=2138 /DNA_ORIENTATION=-
MGKKQHSKDRLYLTSKEWKEEWGGHKSKTSVSFKRLPFHCCAISFTPFEEPVCTEDGTTFETANIVPYVLKYKKHPVTGNTLTLKELYKLNFHKNRDGEFHCPVLNKVFTEHTHIVAIKTTGNVYCHEAVDQLNIKPKNWKDLLTEEPFTRKDIIHIQDPLNISGRTIDQFDHIRCNLSANDEEEQDEIVNGSNLTEKQLAEKRAAKRVEAEQILLAAKRRAGMTLPGSSSAFESSSSSSSKADKVVGEAKKSEKKEVEEEEDWRLKAPARSNDLPSFKPGTCIWDTQDYSSSSASGAKTVGGRLADGKDGNGLRNGTTTNTKDVGAKRQTPQESYEAAGHVKYENSFTSTGAMSRGFTSTCMAISSTNTRERRRIDRNPSKKGYVRLHTSLGDLNLELHCDIVPRTCENFIALCEMGYYNDVSFHRLVKNFMIQGGDPTGTGKGGESIYGAKFKDELDSRLMHAGKGVVSMANSGPNTNGSQFFVTFKSCRHLDFKHSVFGRVVGGLEVLDKMERIVTDDEDHPLQDIRITNTSVFSNPFQEMEDEEKRVLEAAERRKRLGLDESDPRGDVMDIYQGPGANVLIPGLFQYDKTSREEEKAGGPSVGKYLQQRLKQSGGEGVDVRQGSGGKMSQGSNGSGLGNGSYEGSKSISAISNASNSSRDNDYVGYGEQSKQGDETPPMKKTKLTPKSTFSDFSAW